MPKLLFARPPVDAVEERRIRKLAGARHAPADWIRRAQIIAMSWDGLRVPAIAAALGCSSKAVRHRLARFAADGLGPVTPRTFDPPAGWSTNGHRPKAPLTYSRGPDKTWIYGGLRIGDGQAVTCCAPSRNSVHWQAFLARLEQANPTGTIAVITDNLSSHYSLATRAWLTGHPRIEQVFIPKGACWLQPPAGL